MESENPRRGIRLWQLGLCFLLFLGAIFFRSLSGRSWDPSGGAQTLRELAGKAGEALARSPIVEAFAEGFRSGGDEDTVEAAGTAKTTTVTAVTAATTAKDSKKTKTTTEPVVTEEKQTETEAVNTSEQSGQSSETSLPLLTKRAGGNS